MTDHELPPFPVPPPNASRLSHRPTVNAGLRYWSAVRRLTAGGTEEHRTAVTMELIYRAALGELSAARPGDN